MRLEHITIQCADLEASVKFYCECAGLKVIRDMRDRPSNRIVFMGNSDEDTLVELIDSEKPFRGSGVSIGFGVKDVKECREWFIERGYEPTQIRWLGEGRGFFFVADPSGFSVQFITE